MTFRRLLDILNDDENNSCLDPMPSRSYIAFSRRANGTPPNFLLPEDCLFAETFVKRKIAQDEDNDMI